ncbi:TetR/AcrR family transcriptional regulator [Streptomyces sp. NPDC059837]|jgi:AcrR family transcriptional regulator|uniref:TetR/AcrR family transcriptional regulator n=2 Tax=Streptomyces TaxID=1883 RepID=UPI0006CD046C|nr:TetR/AcrR family transcriptional regulator [Streptomyces sp. NBC_00365]KPI18869.1 transcriptional regulator, TetR family [Actinobacteria bacterium OK006]MCX5096899.1 TetR/AcrR family transcriptional regulator [Streptomyces sp. NBC_00365]
METPTRRKRVAKPPEERRKDIMDAAEEVFARKGIAETKIEEITTLAEVSKGTFYLYFKTKDEAAAVLWERYMDNFAGVGEKILSDTDVPLDGRLVDVLESLCRFALQHADLHRVLYDGAGAQEVHAATNERLIGMIAAAARGGVKTGEIECSHPDMMARALFHGFCGAVTDAITGFAPISHDEVITAAGEMTRAVFGLTRPTSA